MNQIDVDTFLQANGFLPTGATGKVIEYRSGALGRFIYFRFDVGLPGYARIVIHPSEDAKRFHFIEGVKVLEDMRFGNAMKQFPKKKRTSDKEIHYGRALNISTFGALEAFSTAFC